MLKDEDMRLLASLWQELADAPAAECGAALRHCMERLASRIGARNILWVSGQWQGRHAPDDPMRGWLIRDMEYLHDGERLMNLAHEVVARITEGEEDKGAVALAQGTGRTRSHLRPELINDEDWRRCWVINDVLAAERIGDRLSGAHAFPGCESHFFLERSRGERPFGEYERELLYYFLLGSRAFQRELLLSRGLMDRGSPLSPREQDVLGQLLTDLSEKEIAQQLGIGHRTVHQHAQRIYAKLRVRGRQGLMALWLRHRRTDR